MTQTPDSQQVGLKNAIGRDQNEANPRRVESMLPGWMMVGLNRS